MIRSPSLDSRQEVRSFKPRSRVANFREEKSREGVREKPAELPEIIRLINVRCSQIAQLRKMRISHHISILKSNFRTQICTISRKLAKESDRKNLISIERQ